MWGKQGKIEFRGNFSTVIGAHPSPSRTQIKRKRTYLISGVGGAGTDPPTSKRERFFLMHLALSVPIINKIHHRTKAEERLKHQDPLKIVRARSAHYFDFTTECITGGGGISYLSLCSPPRPPLLHVLCTLHWLCQLYRRCHLNHNNFSIQRLPYIKL